MTNMLLAIMGEKRLRLDSATRDFENRPPGFTCVDTNPNNPFRSKFVESLKGTQKEKLRETIASIPLALGKLIVDSADTMLALHLQIRQRDKRYQKKLCSGSKNPPYIPISLRNDNPVC